MYVVGQRIAVRAIRTVSPTGDDDDVGRESGSPADRGWGPATAAGQAFPALESGQRDDRVGESQFPPTLTGATSRLVPQTAVSPVIATLSGGGTSPVNTDEAAQHATVGDVHHFVAGGSGGGIGGDGGGVRSRGLRGAVGRVGRAGGQRHGQTDTETPGGAPEPPHGPSP